MTQPEQARRIGLELLVIVAGVLLALSAQTAVEEWSDRQREREFVSDLLTEFQLNDSRLNADIELARQAVAASELWRAGLARRPR